MRRFVSLVVLLLFAIPFGVSISGCSKSVAPTFCNGGDSGITTGQVSTSPWVPSSYGISLNYAQIGQVQPPIGHGLQGLERADRHRLHLRHHRHDHRRRRTQQRPPVRGTWNRNSGGGIPDFTYCTLLTNRAPPTSPPAAPASPATPCPFLSTPWSPASCWVAHLRAGQLQSPRGPSPTQATSRPSPSPRRTPSLPDKC
jgi:hypothetical protein